MNSGNKGLFVLDNKEATQEAINRIKKIIKITLNQTKLLKEQKGEDNHPSKLCKDIITNLYLLIKTIDKNRNTPISKDLDYLYKHCLFAVVRVRDNKDYGFLDGCISVLDEITEGWERVSVAIKKAPAFG
ncbi:MAG: flagellar protein FliS [Pseudomonadota bacterium]|nr:flagellar protein FliS [Pseudomonadota bacterium]